MNEKKLTISVLPHKLAICQVNKDANLPNWVNTNDFFSLTKTYDELSLVCSENSVPQNVKSDTGWRIIKLEGQFNFSETGILADLLNPLAKGKIGIFAISTFDTDYVLVKSNNLEKAINILSHNYSVKK